MTDAIINSRLVSLAEARVSVLDRSFLYGDGIFETLRVRQGRPFRWDSHFDRLLAAATFVGITLPHTSTELRAQASELIARNSAEDSVLRIHLSRGEGSRGYSPRGANRPTLVLTTHPAPVRAPGGPAEWNVIVAPWRIAGSDVLGRFKTANRLLNVMARKAADETDADEALLLNTRGEVCSAAAANLFWIEQGRLFTPPEQAGVRAGVTRQVILELAEQHGEPAGEQDCSQERLRQAQAVFLTQSAQGVVRVRSISGEVMPGRELVNRWQSAYQQALHAETHSP